MFFCESVRSRAVLYYLLREKAIKVRFVLNFPAMLHIFLENSKKNEKKQGNCLTYAQ